MPIQDYIMAKAQDPNFVDTQYPLDYVNPVKSRNAALWKNYQKNLKVQDINELADKMAYDNQVTEVDQYIKYAKDDYIAQIAKTDANVADALQQATESYGAGNLLGSGIQAARSSKTIRNADLQKYNIEKDKAQNIGKYTELRDQAKNKYDQITTPLNNMQRSEIKYRPGRVPTAIEAAAMQLNKDLP